MFMGSLPAPVQSIILEIAKSWDCKEVFVGCSGNFTIERVLCKLNKFNIHGNDVTIFSCLIGWYLAGEKLNVRFNEKNEETMGWLKEYMETDMDIIATLLVMSRIAQYMGKSNAYYDRMIKAYHDQFPTIHQKTKERLEKLDLTLKSFYAGDICELIDKIPYESAVVCYPPFFSGDYEKMFKHLEDIFIWEPPQYDLIDKERIFELFRKMQGKKYWMFGTNDRLEEFSDYLIGMAKTTNRGVPIYVYSNYTKSRICIPNQKIEVVKILRLGPDEDVGDNITLRILTKGEFYSLRSQYMNINIKPGQATLSIGVMVDNKMIGVYAFSTAPSKAKWDGKIEMPHIYLLSDFPVAPSKHGRLAKLVLYAALSKESKLLAERISNHRVRSLITTAFTKRPVSMKYRGILTLLSRKETENKEDSGDPTEAYYSQGYELNYGGKLGEWSLQEGLAIWKKKHGSKGSEGE
jgi:hypothetical protein